MNRRQFVRAGAGLSSALVAGCLGPVESIFEAPARTREPPVLEDRPDAVYYPTHVEGMEMVGTAETDWYTIALSYSFPHRFWTVTGDRAERVGVADDDTIHLMMTAWDTETGVVVPVASQTVELRRDGEVIDDRSLWPMLSQSMGYHFGDNVSLPGDGTYTATVRLGPIDARRTGAFADRFDAPVSVDLEFEYSGETRDAIAFEEFDERAGERGAVEPMAMGDVPLAGTPPREELPGTVLGEERSGDADFVATVIEDGSRFGAENAYLAVSPRTPHNGFPLPFMSLTATLSRDGETVFDGPLRSALDPELASHYGAPVESVRSGDTVAVAVDSPPQVSRHEGYETAFLSMPDVEFVA